MKQQILELPVVEVMDTPSNEKSTSLLARLWDDAERAIAVQHPPNPPARRTNSAQKTVRVRYAYD